MDTDAKKKSHLKASAKYQKANTKIYNFRFNFKYDGKIIDKLESVDNKCGYIKKLITDDIEKEVEN